MVLNKKNVQNVQSNLDHPMILHCVCLFQCHLEYLSHYLNNDNRKNIKKKLDRVGPVENRPSTDWLVPPLYPKKCDMWHQTCDTWNLTRDTWHLTCDTWDVTHGGGWTFSQYFSFLALTVWDFWCFEDLKVKDDWINELMNEWMMKLFIEQPWLHRVC